MARIEVKKLNEHVYLMDDSHAATGYVVVGSKKALVIDTMNGSEDVKAVVRRITDLPIMVVNTHGHCDHIFGNVFFEEAYLHPADLPLAEESCLIPEFVEACKKYQMSMPPFKEIHEGDVIDLGGLTLEVILLSGHTLGSILLLLKEDRILFTGDAINHHLWMQLDDSTSVKEMIANLEKVMYLEQQADYICHGHAQEMDDIHLMSELLAGAKELVAGDRSKDPVYEWFGKSGHEFIFEYTKGSAIVYSDTNIG